MKPDYNDLLTILKNGVLLNVSDDCEISHKKEFYNVHAFKSQENLLCAITLIKTLDLSSGEMLPKEILVYSVLLCGEHSEKCDWTSPQSLTYATQLMDEVLKRCNCSNLSNLILHFGVDAFLSKLRPKIEKNTWKNHPAGLVCFKWILTNIECPFLGDNLESVLPPCLLMVDDHKLNHKIMGLHCLKHVVNNVSQSDLKQYGRGTVIYKALEHMIYSREHEIVKHFGPCMAALLKKTELKLTTAIPNWSHFDDVLNVWLPSMELEQTLALREAYMDNLNELLESMGLASARWLKKLLAVLSEYAESDHTCNKALQNLQTLITVAWPRIERNLQSILIILMKVLIKISRKETSSAQDRTLILVKKCLESLEKLFVKEYSLFMSEIRNTNELKHCYLILNSY